MHPTPNDRTALEWVHRGLALDQFGQYEEAEAAYHEAIGIYRALIADGATDLRHRFALVLMSRGRALSNLNQPGEALKAFDEAIAIYSEEEETVDLRRELGWAWFHRGSALANLRQPAEAVEAYDKAIRIYRRLIKAGWVDLRQELGWMWSCRGTALYRLWRLKEALNAYDEARAIVSSLLVEGRDDLHHEVVSIVTHRGHALAYHGQPAEAIEAFGEAIGLYYSLIQQGQTSLRRDLGWVCIHAGKVFDSVGQPDESVEVFDEAIKIFRALIEEGHVDQSHGLAIALMGRERALSSLDQPTEALEAFEEAIEIYRALIDDGRADLRHELAVVFMGQGYAFDSVGQPDESLKAFAEAIKIFRSLIEEGQVDLRHDLALVLMDRGHTLTGVGQPKEALVAYHEAVTTCENAGESAIDVHWPALLDLAQLLRRSDRREEAAAAIEAAIPLVERLAERIPTLADRMHLRASVLDVYKLAALFAVERNDRAGAFAAAQHAKGRALAELRSEDASTASSERRLADLAWEKYWTAARPSDAQGDDGGETGFGSRLFPGRDVETNLAEREARRRELVATQSGRAFLTFGNVRSLDEIVAVLRLGEALLDLFDVNEGLVVTLVLPGRAEVAWAGKIDAGALDEALQWWAEALQVPNDVIRWEEALEALGNLLLGPVLPFLHEAGITHLIVSLSGRLHGIPMPALRVPDHTGDSRYLAEVMALSAIPAATSLWLLRRRAQPGGQPVLVAVAPFAPGVGDQLPLPLDDATPVADRAGTGRRAVRRGEAPRLLPGTKREVEQIEALVQRQGHERTRSVVLLGADATWPAVTALLPAANLVLLATHGEQLAEGQSVLDYQLLFRSRPDKVDRLAMREVFGGGMRLDGVFQVALTGCHLGEVVLHGEEALGFAQAFLSAGAGVVLAPLWAVDDAATCELSIAYHAELLTPERPTVAEAWRRATARVRATRGWGHPYYWAAFLPQGDGALRLGA